MHLNRKNSSQDMSSLRQSYIDLDYRCGLQSDRLRNNRDYEMNLFIPTKEAKQREEKELDNLLHEAYPVSYTHLCHLLRYIGRIFVQSHSSH